jgi:hypothetical protein
MLMNATITRIDLLGPPNGLGQQVYIAGATVAIPCFLGDVTRQQKWDLESRIADATAVATVEAIDLPTRPADLAQIAFVLDEDPTNPVTMQVVTAVTRRKAGGLSHHEVFVRQLVGGAA